MTVPLTPFEETGDWTSLTIEEQFLNELDGVGELEVEESGRSVQDRPIWSASIGTGDSTALIASLQHGPEPATRESSLALLRDLAYRTELWMDDYLENHRVIVFPTINPDGVALGTRNNANDVNLNRDWFQGSQPETRAVHAVITATDPDVLMDAHETSGQPGADWRPYPAGYPGEWGNLRDLAVEFVDDTEAAFLNEGWTTLWYPINLLPFAGMSTVAGADNRIGVLSETVSLGISPVQRVDISHATYLALLRWHETRRSEIVQARSAARAASLIPGVTEYPTRQYVTTTSPALTSAEGYLLHETLPQRLIDTFGIVLDGGYVSLFQPARRIVAALCDPNSTERVVDASPVFGDRELIPVFQAGTVDQDGVRYPIKRVIVQQDSVRYGVKSTVTQRGGIRFTR